MKPIRLRRSLGISLVEMLVVLTVIAAISLWAIPSFARWQAKQTLQAAAQNRAAALQLARSQAIAGAYRQNIVFCALDETNQCVIANNTNRYEAKWGVLLFENNIFKKILFRIENFDRIAVKTNSPKISFDEQGRPAEAIQYVLCHTAYAVGAITVEMRLSGQMLTTEQAGVGC